MSDVETNKKGSIKIRPAVEEDIKDIEELWKELMDFHSKRDEYFTRGENGHKVWGKRIAEKLKSRHSNNITVAVAGRKVVGYCWSLIAEYLPVFDRDYYGFIVDLSVTADYRHKGVGKKLVNNAIHWFRVRGIERIEVTVAVKNEVSTKFWRKMGFNPYKEIMFYDDRATDFFEI